ncbi:hypothetical protein CAPN010_10160 [Capnocytophaga cynodegmi]|uniref:DUF4297 family anti-phage-associated protein n=1 Tax=Capnocytophaga cynodegmi TaxID=28189 RepID=UPI001EE16147|nr:DUF4297 family anti-phage-associated protein [Capnocytophaga cynodegmi]GJQ06858.1 hypothetical protein CAPN010_10160 [Capnocytophaga cynodegmi]
MTSRSAISTIKGYFYQFDSSILELLKLNDNSSFITVEGIEDIDVNSNDEETAIQCKYYESSEYNHSIIAKPIRLMLKHFSECKKGEKPIIKYKLRGFYQSGQDKLQLPINIEFLKEKFLTYKSSGQRIECHQELQLSDNDLQEFLGVLEIDINAQSYNDQLQEVFRLLKKEFTCSDFEAENYYYNNCLKEIQNLSIESDTNNRRITRQQFIQNINHKKVLFTEWFIKFKTKDKYIKDVNITLKALGALKLNKPKTILIGNELLQTNNSELPIESFIENLIDKFYKIGMLEDAKPLIIILDVNDEEMKNIKKELIRKEIVFNDGFEHLEFSAQIFNTDPIINRNKAGNKISKSSYMIRLMQKSTFSNYNDEINLSGVFINFSQDGVNFSSGQFFDLKYCENLNDVYKILTQ